MRDLIRRLTPSFILDLYRSSKKKSKNAALEEERQRGEGITKKDLIDQFRSIGIKEGDVLLVHSSLSNIGFVENGPADVVEALIESVGPQGHLLMPNSPNASFQLEYIRSLDVFDVAHSPSKLGAISEYFRLLPDAVRSAHPTEPVSCLGPNAEYFVGHHFGNLTPYDQNSPFYRVSERNGKILYLGVTLDNAGTNLHTLEDAVTDFKFPVYYPETFEVKVMFENGAVRSMKTLVHNPDQSKKRKCDGLIPLFIEKGVMTKVKIGKADSLLVDAGGMFDVMLDEYKMHGVTMYTPKGS
jgi:aminoglycoside 3-N-acetyltransferase